MAPQFSYFRLLYPQIRCFASKSTHYDSLGITPKATQADVKSAYYNLSKVYHPDINKDSEAAAQKFRSITSAYEVLGNVKSRKLYDRGLLIGGPESYEEPVNKFYKSREVRSRPPAPYGRTTVYDFDEWSRVHYRATFMRDMMNRKREKQEKVDVQASKDERRVDILICIFGFTLIVFSVFFRQDNDKTIMKTILEK